jgi:hypothetical protein
MKGIEGVIDRDQLATAGERLAKTENWQYLLRLAARAPV